MVSVSAQLKQRSRDPKYIKILEILFISTKLFDRFYWMHDQEQDIWICAKLKLSKNITHPQFIITEGVGLISVGVKFLGHWKCTDKIGCCSFSDKTDKTSVVANPTQLWKVKISVIRIKLL